MPRRVQVYEIPLGMTDGSGVTCYVIPLLLHARKPPLPPPPPFLPLLLPSRPLRIPRYGRFSFLAPAFFLIVAADCARLDQLLQFGLSALHLLS